MIQQTLIPARGNWLDERFYIVLDGNACAAYILNELLRCQVFFGKPFYHSYKQFSENMVQKFCNSTITQAFRLILERLSCCVDRWMGVAPFAQHIAFFSVDLEAFKGWLRENGCEDSLEMVIRSSGKKGATPELQEPIAAPSPFASLNPTLTSSSAWNTLLRLFPLQTTLEMGQYLEGKMRQHGLGKLGELVSIIEHNTARGQKVSKVFNYLQACYNTLEEGLVNAPIIQAAQVTVKPNPEDLSLPEGLEIDVQWQLEGKDYTVLEISGKWVQLEDMFGQVTAFPLSQVRKGHVVRLE